jgi:outer membrane autotransporter protein
VFVFFSHIHNFKQNKGEQEMFKSKLARTVLVVAMLGLGGLAYAQSVPGDIADPGSYDPHHHSSSEASDEMSINASMQNSSYISLGYAQRAVLKQLSDRRDAVRGGEGVASGSMGMTPWIAPYYYHTRRNDMGPDGSVVKSDAGGSSFGLDWAFGDLLVGGAFDKGYSKTKYSHDAVSSEDEGDFYSFMGYADWERDKLRIYGALGFAFDSHDIEFKNNGARVDKADADTYAISSALICEYKLYDEAVYVKPYAGIRHAYINSESYKIAGTSYNNGHQNIFRFPVGVKVGHDFNFSGIIVRPLVNIGMEPVRGNTKSKTTVRSVGTKETSKADMCDEFYWNASAGVTCNFYGISCTLAYEFQGSGHDNEHGVSFSYNWRF